MGFFRFLWWLYVGDQWLFGRRMSESLHFCVLAPPRGQTVELQV